MFNGGFSRLRIRKNNKQERIKGAHHMIAIKIGIAVSLFIGVWMLLEWAGAGPLCRFIVGMGNGALIVILVGKK
jgi:hypothetical protein